MHLLSRIRRVLEPIRPVPAGSSYSRLMWLLRVYLLASSVAGTAAYFLVPTIRTVLWLFLALAWVAALLLIVRAYSWARVRARVIDTVVITTGVGLTSWVLADAAVHSGQVTAVRRVVAVAYVVCSVTWGCFALVPAQARSGEIAPRLARPTRYLLRKQLLTASALIVPTVLLAGSVTGLPAHHGVMVWSSALLVLLHVVRLWGLLDERRGELDLERTFVRLGAELVAAHGQGEIYRVALDCARFLTGVSGDVRAAIYVVGPDLGRCVAGRAGPQDLAPSGRLLRGAQAGGRRNAAATVSELPLWHDLATWGVLVVERVEPISVEQHAALVRLAAQVSIAVESANLAEGARRRQGEERLGVLLQNARDVIVVVDRLGVITYATPSLGRNLGLAVEQTLGLQIADFLAEEDRGDARELFASFEAGATPTRANTDWHLVHADGTCVAFEVLSGNLLEDASVAGIVLTMRDVSERRAFEVRLTHQAFHDPLTGLSNRALFADRAGHAMARAARSGAAIAMLSIDLDDFKEVNDTHGHAGGDELLQQVAARLQAGFRADATVARFGGDEFAVLVEDVSQGTRMTGLAERALGAFATPFTVHGEDLRVGASIGLVVTGGIDDTLDMTELMRSADLALYAAKERGKGQLVQYEKDLSTRMRDRLDRRTELERALEADEFVVHFQPMVAIETGEVTGCEALVRWQHPDRGMLPPTDFIALAEETGLIIELGRWVLDRACAQLASWSGAGRGALQMSVNVSARQLREPGFADEAFSAIRRHRLRPGQLVLELTESVLALDVPQISEHLHALRAAGVRISMDDFGTGYSSLSYLQTLPFDILKIDKSFVDRLGTRDPDAGVLVNAVIALAHSLRLEVVAEGIENAEQRDELWLMGCRLGQGYLYSRPVEPGQISAFLAGFSTLGPPPVPGQWDRIRDLPRTVRGAPSPAQRLVDGVPT
jgi:diguanylate cyclase (GGDEF)-like protein/PAS domain S-box-containing protein